MTPEELAQLLPTLGGRFDGLSLRSTDGLWWMSIHERLEEPIRGDRYFKGLGATPEEAMQEALEKFKNREPPRPVRVFSERGREVLPQKEISLDDLGL